MRIAVEVLPRFKTNPNLIAGATVSMETETGFLHIHDCCLVQNKNGIVWFPSPTFSLQHAARQFEYRQTIEGVPAVAQLISAQVLQACEVWKQAAGVRS